MGGQFKYLRIYAFMTGNLYFAKCNKNKLNRTPEHDFLSLSFPLSLCGKNGQKISEYIFKYYQKYEIQDNLTKVIIILCAT